ncbi:MAG TPA: type 4a pilus biogenesis protein PilO [Candidatus Paceibacterota bacterium]
MISFSISFMLIIGSVLIYAFLVVPTYDDIQRARGDLVSKTKIYNDQKRVFDKIKSLNDAYKGNGTLQDAVSLALPNETFISQILGNIEGLASLNNRMSILSAQTEILPFRANASWPFYIKNIGTVKLALQMRGTYGDFKKFISQIENNYRIMDIKQMEMRSDQNDKTRTAFVYGLTIYAYYQNVAKSAASNK